MNCFLEPHEKIRQIRKKYKITQVELAGDIYTQGYITSLERGIKKPTEKNIIDLVERFNQLLVQKKINDIIHIDDIRKNRVEEEEIVKNILKEIRETKYIDEFMKKYRKMNLEIIELSEKNQIIIFEEFFKVSKKLECWEAMRDISVILMMKNENNLEKFGEAFLELTRSCIYIDDSDFIITYEENYEEKLENIPLKVQEDIYHNLRYIYQKKNYEERALKCIEKLEKLYQTKEELGQLLIDKGAVLELLGRNEEVKTTYIKVINENQDNMNLLTWATQNMISVLIKEDNIKEVRKNYNFLKKKLEINELPFKNLRYGSLGEVAFYLKRTEESKEFYEKALDSLFDEYYGYREVHYADWFEGLFSQYKKEDREKVKKYRNVFKKIQKKENIKRSSFAFIKYYNENKLYNELKDFLDMYKNMM